MRTHMRVLVELRSPPEIRMASIGPELQLTWGFVADPSYPAVRVGTYLIRGTVPADTALAHPEIVGVFSDPVIEPVTVCPGDRAIGTARTVGSRLGATALHRAKLDGRGVSLAI